MDVMVDTVHSGLLFPVHQMSKRRGPQISLLRIRELSPWHGFPSWCRNPHSQVPSTVWCVVLGAMLVCDWLAPANALTLSQAESQAWWRVLCFFLAKHNWRVPLQGHSWLAFSFMNVGYQPRRVAWWAPTPAFILKAPLAGIVVAFGYPASWRSIATLQ